MRFVVLGARGFIGGRMMALLGGKAMGFASQDIDLRDEAGVVAGLCPHLEGATLVYSAGKHRQHSDSFETYLDNQRMVGNLIAAMRETRPARVIFLSSVEIYGAPVALPVTEATPPRPDYLYAVGKLACEHLLERHCRMAGIPLAVLRLPGIYGVEDGGRSIIGKLVAATRGQSFKLMGTGGDLRDYVLVDDVVRLVQELGEGPEFGHLLLNVATGRSYSINELIDMIATRFGPLSLERVPSAGGHFDLRFDVTHLTGAVAGFSLSQVPEVLDRWTTQFIEREEI